MDDEEFTFADLRDLLADMLEEMTDEQLEELGDMIESEVRERE